MDDKTYKKATEIKRRIEDLETLRRIAYDSYKTFSLFKKNYLHLSGYIKDKVVLCDDELSKLISAYCDKRIDELREELKLL